MHSSLAAGTARRIVSQTEKDILCKLDYTIIGQSVDCENDCVIIPVSDGFFEASSSSFTLTANAICIERHPPILTIKDKIILLVIS